MESIAEEKTTWSYHWSEFADRTGQHCGSSQPQRHQHDDKPQPGRARSQKMKTLGSSRKDSDSDFVK